MNDLSQLAASMRAACPVECKTSIELGEEGFTLVWRYAHPATQKEHVYVVVLSYEGVALAACDLMRFGIAKASKKMEKELCGK